MSGPLQGYRIIDATQMVAGPMATMLLADQGAEVIKIEPPGGDLTRAFVGRQHPMAPLFATCNRNKRSVVVDLKHPEGPEVVHRLVESADLFVQNLRPGAADKLRVGEAALRRVKPDLVYVSISGFGESGPYAHKRAYDPVIQALSGLAEIQADPQSGRPRMMRLIIADKVTALTAAQAMTAALLARQRTGMGQHVRLAMLDAVVAFLWAEGMAGLTWVDGDATGLRPRNLRDLVFETSDGFITAGAMSDREWQGLVRALERPEWLADPRFATPAAREHNAEARLELTAAVLKTKTSREWLARLEAEEVPCAPVLGRRQMLDDPQIRANQTIVEFDHPSGSRIRQARPAATFDGTRIDALKPAPSLGQDTEQILSEIGLDAAQVAHLKAIGAVNQFGSK